MKALMGSFNMVLVMTVFLIAFAGINNKPITIDPIPVWLCDLIFILTGGYIGISIIQFFKWLFNKKRIADAK